MMNKIASAEARSKAYVPIVVVSYAASSLGGVFVNKACLSGYNFGFPLTLIFLQLLFSVISLSILRLVGMIELPVRTFRELLILLYPAVFFIANVSVGLYALKIVNIPMFSAFRRLTVLNVIIMEYFVLKKLSSRKVLFCVAFMIIGSIVAAVGDLTFDPLGYILVFLNNLLTAGNLVSIKKASQVVSLDAMAMFYYVSLVSLPLVALLAVGVGDMEKAWAALLTQPELQTPGFLVALCLSASSAFLINYTTNLCTQVTSALTTCITGQTKNILQTLIGIFSWGYEASPLNLLGLFLALVASTLFAQVKYQESNAPVAKGPAEQPLTKEDNIKESEIGDAKPKEVEINGVHEKFNDKGA
mmetsp:Transcript_6147/g.11107  ORF Transcript_6147/g.11107 Transcript_6147/m.11107 type:complete len:359 (+) Transcript_6147:467-1543(+)